MVEGSKIDYKFYVELFHKTDTIALIHSSTNYQSSQLFFYKHLKVQLDKDGYLSKKKHIEIEDILKLITLSPDSYSIRCIEIPSLDYVVDIGDTDAKKYENTKLGRHFLQLNQRLDKFKLDFDKWLSNNAELDEIPIDWSVVARAAKNIFMSHDRVVIQKTKSIGKVVKTKKDLSFKEKAVSPVKGSLLDRIRAKEKFNNDNKSLSRDQDSYNRYEYLDSKLNIFYEIIYEKSTRGGDSTQHSLRKLTSNIQDSLSYPIDEADIKNALMLMSKKLTIDKLSIVNINNVEIVKVGKLNRTNDLKMLHKSIDL